MQAMLSVAASADHFANHLHYQSASQEFFIPSPRGPSVTDSCFPTPLVQSGIPGRQTPASTVPYENVTRTKEASARATSRLSLDVVRPNAGVDMAVEAHVPPRRHSAASVVLNVCDDLNIGMEFYLLPGASVNSKGALEAKTCQDDVCIVRQFSGCSDSAFFGVFDGHGEQGHRCANWLVANLPQLIATYPGSWREEPKAAFKAACVSAEKLLRVNHEIDTRWSGSTACFIVILDDDVHVGNVGDSRAVLGTVSADGRSVRVEVLTKDHKPSSPMERLRILRQGGQVCKAGPDDLRVSPAGWGKNGAGLSMSRSIGDTEMHLVGVIPKPSCTSLKISQTHSQFIILASDGIWEVFTSQEAVDWVYTYSTTPASPGLRTCSQAFVEEARRRWEEKKWSRVDDITALIVNLNPGVAASPA